MRASHLRLERPAPSAALPVAPPARLRRRVVVPRCPTSLGKDLACSASCPSVRYCKTSERRLPCIASMGILSELQRTKNPARRAGTQLKMALHPGKLPLCEATTVPRSLRILSPEAYP